MWITYNRMLRIHLFSERSSSSAEENLGFSIEFSVDDKPSFAFLTSDEICLCYSSPVTTKITPANIQEIAWFTTLLVGQITSLGKMRVDLSAN